MRVHMAMQASKKLWIGRDMLQQLMMLKIHQMCHVFLQKYVEMTSRGPVSQYVWERQTLLMQNRCCHMCEMVINMFEIV